MCARGGRAMANAGRNRFSDRSFVALAMLLLLACLPAATFAAPRPSHFWLCAHHDWSAKKGYFLVLENTFDDGAPSKLADARLVLAVGDGNDFRYLRGTTPFALDR